MRKRSLNLPTQIHFHCRDIIVLQLGFRACFSSNPCNHYDDYDPLNYPLNIFLKAKAIS